MVLMNKRFFIAMNKVIALSTVIFAVSAMYIHNEQAIAWVVFGLGLLCIAALKLFKIEVKSVWPDIVFGLIDNGFLALFAVAGGSIAGVSGAIIGGAVGNAITDGIAGVFEGHMAERLREQNISESRTMLGSSVGKMAGCLLGAGAVLIVSILVNPKL